VKRQFCIALMTLVLGCGTLDQRQTAESSRRVHSLIGEEVGLDHVLLWSGDQAAAEKALSDRGFSLSFKAGSYGAGISNRIVWFENWSFIEFLWLSEPERAKAEAPEEYAFVSKYSGSNAFGISIEDADTTYAALSKAGLDPDEPGAEAWDPDGPAGPAKPIINEWRFMFLKSQALAGNPFFVEYRKASNEPRAETHPNGALKLSAVWVLVHDLERAITAYRGAQFTPKGRVSIKTLELNGVSLSAGDGEIFLLEPAVGSSLRTALKDRGDHVYGISVQVANLERAKVSLSSDLESDHIRQKGYFGRSLLLPAESSLGLLIELHE
jgi:Glyoxalase-like domain